MAYAWRFAPVTPDATSFATPVPPSFASQSDAESWVGEQWRSLSAAGVEHVTLIRDGEELYRMSLAA